MFAGRSFAERSERVDWLLHILKIGLEQLVKPNETADRKAYLLNEMRLELGELYQLRPGGVFHNEQENAEYKKVKALAERNHITLEGASEEEVKVHLGKKIAKRRAHGKQEEHHAEKRARGMRTIPDDGINFSGLHLKEETADDGLDFSCINLKEDTADNKVNSFGTNLAEGHAKLRKSKMK